MYQLQIVNFPGINPDDRSNPELVTAASPEDRIVKLLNSFQLDTRIILEEALEGVDLWASPP